MQTKIATCCYCGTRAALVLKGDVKHELSCAGCGAPLHDLKRMPMHHEPAKKVKYHAPTGYSPKKKKKSKPKYKKRKSLFAEAFDILEDIFD